MCFLKVYPLSLPPPAPHSLLCPDFLSYLFSGFWKGSPFPFRSLLKSQYCTQTARDKASQMLNGHFKVFKLQDPTFPLKLCTHLAPWCHSPVHPHLPLIALNFLVGNSHLPRVLTCTQGSILGQPLSLNLISLVAPSVPGCLCLLMISELRSAALTCAFSFRPTAAHLLGAPLST